ncbi:MAG: hypothetical protein M3P49_17290, partial [Actinomycetota bacterium]|nr:hypothetical protein [Actinomycetota bacterium]
MIAALLCLVLSACGEETAEGEAAAPPPADYGGEGAEQASDGPAKADYDGPATPSEEPIKVVLRVSGSEGGAYKGWHWTSEKGKGSIFGHTDKPDFRDVLGSEHKDYEISLGDGVKEASDGDLEWDKLWVDLKKAKRGGRTGRGRCTRSCSSTVSRSTAAVPNPSRPSCCPGRPRTTTAASSASSIARIERRFSEM